MIESVWSTSKIRWVPPWPQLQYIKQTQILSYFQIYKKTPQKLYQFKQLWLFLGYHSLSQGKAAGRYCHWNDKVTQH